MEEVTELYNNNDFNEWRLDKIIHLKSIVQSEGLTDDFMEDFLESIDLGNKHCQENIIPKLPFIESLVACDELDSAECIIGEFMENPQTQEFLIIKCDAQIPKYHTDLKGYSSNGWGYYSTRWCVVKTINEAEIFAHKFSEEIHEKAKKEKEAK